jgi:hypothetical protein
MNVYKYIAETDPNSSNELCKKYGYYQNQYIEDIPICLEQIVGEHGETAFKEILSLHPDKDVILEVYQPQPEPTMLQQPKQDCSCMMNADGTTNAASLTGNTNTMILLAAIVISISIIAIKK